MATSSLYATGSVGGLLLAVAAIAQDTVCASALSPPGYPPLARVERSTGTIDVRFQVGPDRKAREIKCEGRAAFCESARTAIESTRFEASCLNSWFTVVMEFELEGESAVEPVTIVTFRTPNRYQITSNPAPPPQPKRKRS